MTLDRDGRPTPAAAELWSRIRRYGHFALLSSWVWLLIQVLTAHDVLWTGRLHLDPEPNSLRKLRLHCA